MLKLHVSSWLPSTTISLSPPQLRCAMILGDVTEKSLIPCWWVLVLYVPSNSTWVSLWWPIFIDLWLSHPISVCIWVCVNVCVCVKGAGELGGTLLVIIGGGGPELELGKDWRRFPPHCPAGSLLIVWFWWPIMVPGCCSDVVSSYVEGLGLLPSRVVCPKRGDVYPLGSQHPEAFQIPVFSLAVVLTFLCPFW